MSRPTRLERAGVWYHVTARGNEKRRIFLENRDRVRFLYLLRQTAVQYGVVIHAYVLMDNHFHLLIETPEANLSAAMHWLNVSYSVWFNRRHQRVGHLFQGRFGARLVDPIHAGLEISRYLHLNPVRTDKLGLGKKARSADRSAFASPPDPDTVRKRIQTLRSYRWSSYRAYLGLEKSPDWLNCGRVLQLIGGRDRSAQRAAYQGYVESAIRQGLPESPWERLQAGLVLGSKKFLNSVRREIAGDQREQPSLGALRCRPSLTQIIEVVESIKQEEWEDFRDRYGDWGRDLVLYLGRVRCGLKLRELAASVGGVDYTAVSLAVKRFKRRLELDREAARNLAMAEAILSNTLSSNPGNSD